MGVSLATTTWFQVGGIADVVFRPEDTKDLAFFLETCPPEIPVTIIGLSSNLLVRDGGIPGVVIRLGRGFSAITVLGEKRIRCGAAALSVHVANVACSAGIGGIEFLSGIPGTIGGAIRMNAGAYGVEIRNILVEAEAIDGRGCRHCMSPGEIGFSYRCIEVAGDWIFTEAVLQGYTDEKAAISSRMAQIHRERKKAQPLPVRTGGSTFKNPSNNLHAWQLIDYAGCRGLRHGGAVISHKHCNFLINTGQATADDLETLGEEVRYRVMKLTGVSLEWEIHRIGKLPV